MNISAILTALVVVGAVGLILGVFLGVASIVFKVDVDEREEAVLGALRRMWISGMLGTCCGNRKGRGGGECLSGRR